MSAGHAITWLYIKILYTGQIHNIKRIEAANPVVSDWTLWYEDINSEDNVDQTRIINFSRGASLVANFLRIQL